MTRPDPLRVIQDLDRHRASLSDARSLQLLDTLRRHMHAESVVPDARALMAEFGADPRISTWGSSRRDWGGSGPEELRRIAERDCALPWATAVEFRLDTLVVDSDCVALEGNIRRRIPGAVFAEAGFEVNPDVEYEWSTMMAVFYSFDLAGRISGIDTYASGEVMDRIVPVPANGE